MITNKHLVPCRYYYLPHVGLSLCIASSVFFNSTSSGLSLTATFCQASAFFFLPNLYSKFACVSIHRGDGAIMMARVLHVSAVSNSSLLSLYKKIAQA